MSSSLGPDVLPFSATVALITVVVGVVAWIRGTHSADVGRSSGMATRAQLAHHLGPKAIAAKGRTVRPSLPPFRAGSSWLGDYGMFLGHDRRGRRRRRLWLPMEDSVAIVAPTRTGKTTFTAIGYVLDSPGPVVATSTKNDLLTPTITARQRRGPVFVFDPQDCGGWPDQLRWSPITGCQDPDTALQRGMAWAAAAPMDGASNGQWFNEQAAFVLTCLLHAAALTGQNMRTVVRWASDFTDPEPSRILREDPRAPLAWAGQFLTVTASRADKTVDSIAMTLSALLRPLASPKVLEAVCPEEGEEFDATDFLTRSGTLYVLSTSGGRSAAPLITMLIDHVVETAKHLSQRQTGGRLDPPLRLVLDEAPQVAPLPDLPGLMADSGGRGITVVVYAQTVALMRQRWGDDGAKAVWDAASTTMIFGGIKDATMLRDLSDLCGQRQVPKHSTSQGERGDRSRSTSTEWEPVLRVEQLRGLQHGQALMLYRQLPPALIHLQMWKNRLDADQLEADQAAADQHIKTAARKARGYVNA